MVVRKPTPKGGHFCCENPLIVYRCLWEIGKDIPVGHWTITVSEKSYYGFGTICYCDKLDEIGKNPDYDSSFIYAEALRHIDADAVEFEITEIDLELKTGYVII